MMEYVEYNLVCNEAKIKAKPQIILFTSFCLQFMHVFCYFNLCNIQVPRSQKIFFLPSMGISLKLKGKHVSVSVSVY
jgi:hypothetical protein